MSAGDTRGMAFITTLFVLFSVGMMLAGFVFMTHNESFLAGRNRNTQIALGLAEAGAQEAMARLQMGAIVPGSQSFPNSLAGTSPLSPSGTLNNQPCPPSTQANTVTYQAPLTIGGQKLSIYPICSTATFGSTNLTAGVQRSVRLYMLATFKPGASNVIFTPQANFQADARPVSGDSYTMGSINFQSGNVPQCAAGATATNLPSPQVFAGTSIDWQSAAPGCGASGVNGPWTSECTTTSDPNYTEVAPTPCPGAGGRNNMPYNFHPLTPIGMPQADFVTVLNNVPPPGVSIVFARQNGVVPAYPTPATYPAPYKNDVMLINSTGQFCVNSASNLVALATGGTCPGPLAPTGPWALYGNSTNRTRFIDWGLITADTTSGTATTFFQPAMCTAPCPNPGLQNGIRYIPLPINIDVQSKACNVNVNPGTNVVDNTSGVVLSCGAGITVINQTSVTFTGTKSNPESLIILNNPGPGSAVTISGSPTPGALPTSCTPYSWFDTYNWGQILATGDVTFGTSLGFAGFLYAKGNITFNSDSAVWGAIYSPQAGTGSGTSFLTLNSTTTFCGGNQISMLNPLLMNYSQYAWQDPSAPGGIR
jgi:hypothetical protein